MEQYSTAISTSFDSALASHLEQLSDAEFWALAYQQAAITGSAVSHEEYLECKLDGSGGRCLLALEALSQVVLPPHRFALLPAMPDWMIGLVAWRGDTLPVVDLAAYLADSKRPLTEQPSEGILLVTNAISEENSSLGLLIPAIGLTTPLPREEISTHDASVGCPAPSRIDVVQGSSKGTPILDVHSLLTDIVQRIGMAALG